MVKQKRKAPQRGKPPRNAGAVKKAKKVGDAMVPGGRASSELAVERSVGPNCFSNLTSFHMRFEPQAPAPPRDVPLPDLDGSDASDDNVSDDDVDFVHNYAKRIGFLADMDRKELDRCGRA